MNSFVNSVFSLCHSDLRKLYHAIGFDIKERFHRLFIINKNIKNVINILNYSYPQNNLNSFDFPLSKRYKDYPHEVAVRDNSKTPE
jgi:hypothetical protein